MLPNQNETLVLACVAVITGAPFYFRAWVSKYRPQPAQVEKKVSRLTAIIFVALFLGAFLFSERSKASGEILLAASILSFSFLYRTRWTHLSGPRSAKVSNQQNRNQLKHKIFTLAAFVSLALVCAKYSLIVPLLVLAYPFCSSFLVRLQHPCQRLADSELRSDIQNIFDRAQVKLKEVYVIDTSRSQTANAMMAQNTLFMTLPLLEKLNESEILAVVCHEASHLQSHHAVKRIFWGFAYLGLSLFWLGLPLSLSFSGNIAIASVALVATVILQIFLISRKIQQQEFEADLKAVHLGARRTDLISALEKLSSNSSPNQPLARLLSGNFHPTAAARVQALDLRFNTATLVVLPQKKYWAAYSLLLIGLFFHSLSVQTQLPTRSLASAVISSPQLAPSAN